MQPVVGVIALVYCLACLFRKDRMDEAKAFFLASLFAMTAYAAASIFILDGFSVITTYLTCLVGPALFMMFYRNFRLITARTYKLLVVIFLVVGLWESFFYLTSLFARVNAAVAPLFTKLDMYPGAAGRGILYWFTEPSYAAPYIVLLLGLGAHFRDQGALSRKWYGAGILAVLLLVFWNKSGSAALLLLLVAGLWAVVRFAKAPMPHKVVALVTVTGGIVLLPVVVNVLSSGLKIRFMELIKALVDVLYSGGIAKLLTIEMLDFFASMRFVSVLVGYGSIGLSTIGFGLGSALTVYADVSRALGIDPYAVEHLRRFSVENIKPSSYFAQLGLDMGVVGVVLCVPLVIYLVRRIRTITSGTRALVFAAAGVGLVQLLFVSTTTIPAPWLALCLVAAWRMPVAEEAWRGEDVLEENAWLAR
jgi:hypothetical protein